jgi:hypothetical protein
VERRATDGVERFRALRAAPALRIGFGRATPAPREASELDLGLLEQVVLDEPSREQVAQREQPRHVALEVGDLLGRHRASRPVRGLPALVELDAEVRAQQVGQPDARLGQQRGGDHRVEHAFEGDAVVAREHAHVVVAAVQHHLETRSREGGAEREERGQRQRIHDRALGVRRELHDARALPVGVQRVALRVQRHARRAREARRERVQVLRAIHPRRRGAAHRGASGSGAPYQAR